MKKKLIALILVVCLSIFPMNAFAEVRAVCPKSPDDVHHYDAHRSLHNGYASTSTHSVLTGYHGSVPDYEDCTIVFTFEYCENCCVYCSERYSGSTHVHLVGERHSINHT